MQTKKIMPIQQKPKTIKTVNKALGKCATAYNKYLSFRLQEIRKKKFIVNSKSLENRTILKDLIRDHHLLNNMIEFHQKELKFLIDVAAKKIR